MRLEVGPTAAPELGIPSSLGTTVGCPCSPGGPCTSCPSVYGAPCPGGGGGRGFALRISSLYESRPSVPPLPSLGFHFQPWRLGLPCAGAPRQMRSQAAQENHRPGSADPPLATELSARSMHVVSRTCIADGRAQHRPWSSIRSLNQLSISPSDQPRPCRCPRPPRSGSSRSSSKQPTRYWDACCITCSE